MSHHVAKLDLAKVYGEDDLAELCIFSGGYINFGYWKNINLDKAIITEQDRTQSSRDLYNHLFEQFNLIAADKVLEVGCGRGYGAATALERAPGIQMIAMDFIDAQVYRAKAAQAKLIDNASLFLIQGEAESIPFTNAYFDKIFSVEAAQHFQSINRFLNEVWRTLVPGGKLVLITFFSCKNIDVKKIYQDFPYVEQGVDHLIPLPALIDDLKDLGFVHIQCESIGEHVWYGFDRWLAQSIDEEHQGAWSRNWFKAYQQGIVDYVVVSAMKPVI